MRYSLSAIHDGLHDRAELSFKQGFAVSKTQENCGLVHRSIVPSLFRRNVVVEILMSTHNQEDRPKMKAETPGFRAMFSYSVRARKV